jgi:hypothetical protein
MSDRPGSIELAIQEPLGIDRPNHPVTMGVPFPQGALASPENLRIEASDQQIPLQTRTMLTWPDGSVKWVLLDFQTDLKSGEKNSCHLFYGDGVESAPPEKMITVDRNADNLQVSTGPLSFTVSSSGPFPLHSATLEGRSALPEGALLSDLRVDGETYELRVTQPPQLEESGPLRAVIKVEGKAVSQNGTTAFDATARLYAWAGHPTLKIYLTLTNRIPQRLVHLESWQLRLRPQLGDQRDAFLVSSAATGHRKAFVDDLIDGSRTLRVGLVDMPFPPWEPTTRDMDDETPEQPRRADPQYDLLPGEDGEEITRRPAADWHTLMPAAGVLGDAETTVSFWCRRFWHNAPKEITITPDGIDLHLYPQWADPLEWHRGVAKTHELLLDFRSGPADRDERLAFTCAFEKEPAPQVATRNWMVDSGVFGPLFRYQPEKYRWWEYILRAGLQKHTFNVQSDVLMGFSFLDYGDFWRTGRGGQWYNNEMDKGYALILQMVRTGYGVVMEHIEPIIHHQIDIDTIHDAEEEWQIGAQRYHFAKHGAMLHPSLCHEWIEGPLFYYLLTGYRRAEEVALARAEHFRKAIAQGKHRAKTLTRVAGYPLMALARIYDNYRDENDLEICEQILDWLEEWRAEDGGFFYIAYTPPGNAKVGTALSDGILSCALMRHHDITGSERSWKILKQLLDDDIQSTGVFNEDGFTLKSSSPFRDYYEPEPDFFFEPLIYASQQTGDPQYAELGYADMQRIFVQRNMLVSAGNEAPPHFYRYWLPFLARADELGILADPKPF